MDNLTSNVIRRVSLALLLCMVLAATMTVQARRIHVKDGCDLRDAIRAANYNSAIGDCPAGDETDTIILYSDVKESKSMPEINTDITLDGNGRKVTIGDKPAFVIDDGMLTLRNIRIYYETPRSEDIMIMVDGSLTLANAWIQNCSGGIDVEDTDESKIELQGDWRICQHSIDVVYKWFDYKPPAPPSCATLTDATVSAAQGLESGVECRDIDAGAVGNQAVYDAGFIDAVDVWGYVGAGVEICFPWVGAMMFLDAATSPRALSAIDSYASGGKTCAFLNRPGTAVLVAGQPTTTAPPAAVSEPAPAPEPEPAPMVSEPSVDGCPIRTTGHINFRAEPSLDAERLGHVLRGTTVGSISRIWGWYQIRFQGRTGWIGGKNVDNIGNCQ